MLLQFAFLTLVPAFAHALVGLDWSISGGPDTGLKDITFPINMQNATHTYGYFYAMQFGFDGINGVGYTGLQPRPDSHNQSVVHGAFSSFINGTTTNDPNCHSDADGGPGVTCSVEIAAPSYNHTYNMLVENTAGTTTWTGTMVDTSTRARTRVGSWTLPTSAQGINGGSGFIEYIPWNNGGHLCNTLPWTEVFFGTPTTAVRDAIIKLSTAYEYGDCIGKVNFHTASTADGSDTTVGFRNAGIHAYSNTLEQVVLL